MKLTVGCLAFLAGLFVVSISGAPASLPDTAEVRELGARCVAGKLDPAFQAAFNTVVAIEVKRSFVRESLAPDWWDWLAAHPALRDDLMLAVAQAGPKVAIAWGARRNPRRDQMLALHHGDSLFTIPRRLRNSLTPDFDGDYCLSVLMAQWSAATGEKL